MLFYHELCTVLLVDGPAVLCSLVFCTPLVLSHLLSQWCCGCYLSNNVVTSSFGAVTVSCAPWLHTHPTMLSASA